MRRLIAVPLVLLLLAAQAGSASAQVTSHPPGFMPGPYSPLAPGVSPPISHSMFSRVATGVGAAAVGAWVGFFMSQVALGDWDQAEGRGTIHRTTWAGIGGALGFSLGFSFPIGGKPGPFGASEIGPSTGPGMALPTGRAMISTTEISRSGATTAYDIVRNLRPDWLIEHAPNGSINGVPFEIKVYLDAQLLGGPDALSSVSASDVGSMYRIDALHATTRWGSGNEEGAILILTKR